MKIICFLVLEYKNYELLLLYVKFLVLVFCGSLWMLVIFIIDK